MSSDTPRARKNAARQYQAAHPGTPYPVALRAVTPQRGATIIDREYVDYRDIAPIYGLDLDTDHPTGGFQFESDWYFNLAGRGLNPGVGPGTGTGRWLVTYASPKQARLNGDPDEFATGWLSAYAIDRHDAKTGRCVVIAGPWNSATDDRLQRQSPREDDTTLDGLIDWLRTQL